MHVSIEENSMKILHEFKIDPTSDSVTLFPKVVLEDGNQKVSIIDDFNKVSLTVKQFNELIRAIKAGKIKTQ
jgi:hypothetical protein